MPGAAELADYGGAHEAAGADDDDALGRGRGFALAWSA